MFGVVIIMDKSTHFISCFFIIYHTFNSQKVSWGKSKKAHSYF